MLLSKRAALFQPALPEGQARLAVIAAAKKQQKKQRKQNSSSAPPRRKGPFDDAGYEEDNSEFFMSAPGPSIMMPEAPPPSALPKSEKENDSGYAVFAPRPSNIQQIRGGSWGWDEEEVDTSRPPVPEWNPRTGFMGTGADDASSSSGGSGASTSGPSRVSEPDVQASFLTPAVSAEGELPTVSKGQILTSCLGTSFWMTIFALFLRQYALVNSTEVLGTDPRLLAELLRIPSGFESWENVGIAVGAVAAVTSARLLLLNTWPEFRVATNRSNRQVLQPLGWLDVVLVAALTGATEELLFRGAIIPASFPDWRGAVLSGVIFGLLHNSGGRNLAFAAWASGVGIFYGGLFVVTHNIWVPASAHMMANFCSAAVWKARSETGAGKAD